MGHFCSAGPGSGFRIRIRIHWPDWIWIQSGSGSETLVPIYLLAPWRLISDAAGRLTPDIAGRHSTQPEPLLRRDVWILAYLDVGEEAGAGVGHHNWHRVDRGMRLEVAQVKTYKYKGASKENKDRNPYEYQQPARRVEFGSGRKRMLFDPDSQRNQSLPIQIRWREMTNMCLIFANSQEL